MIFIYSDILGRTGGIETYVHALASHLKQQNIPVRVTVSEQEPCELLNDLEQQGIEIYRQPMVPGDRWNVRKRLLIRWVKRRLLPGDWVFCVRQPIPELFLKTVRAVHARGAKIAVSWMFAPEFLRPPENFASSFNQAVKETDAVISVSRCTVHQFRDIYGFEGPVHVVPYHNLEVFKEVLPVPPFPPYRIGYMGRIEIGQKNLDSILKSFGLLANRRDDVELHIYGGGPDEGCLKMMTLEMNLGHRVLFHGAYDHRRDLPRIISFCHFFVHTSRFEGGPCFSLLELLQAGRFVVTSPVGGIPDIYDGRPDIGSLVPPDDPPAIAQALEEALKSIANSKIRSRAVRQRYDNDFTTPVAHAAWMRALELRGSASL
jgi:glycosyltransferase involved in cell wall biosynthesis